jgi:hypothetical protein
MVKDLQDPIQMRHARTISVEEVGENVIVVGEVLFGILDLIGHFLEELGLDSGEGFQRGLARLDQLGMGVSPLGNLVLSLVGRLASVLKDLFIDLEELFDELILPMLDFDQLPGQSDEGGGQIRRPLLARRRTAGVGGDIDGKDGRKWALIVRHDDLGEGGNAVY